MTVNGQVYHTDCSVKLTVLLDELGYDQTKIAVELNGMIISRANYAKTNIQQDDCLEIVSFVGGG